jgi:2-amino-4-hydroxy-6-hydroxymethyldihydropteridine diphosphokinase
VGSNIGDKRRNCQKGIEALTAVSHTTLVAQSRFYETEPVDYRDQDWFVNGVIKVKTGFEPFSLLDELKAIEKRLGRAEHPVRFGPRVIDLDIILYGGRTIDTPRLVVPHPRMHQRRFVLEPICDIDPDLVHPVIGRTMAQLLNSLDRRDQSIKAI